MYFYSRENMTLSLYEHKCNQNATYVIGGWRGCSIFFSKMFVAISRLLFFFDSQIWLRSKSLVDIVACKYKILVKYIARVRSNTKTTNKYNGIAMVNT